MEISVHPFRVNFDGLVDAFSQKPGFFLLDSSLRQRQRGRYSFMGYDPFRIVRGGDLRAFVRLRNEFSQFSFKKRFALTPFPAGLAGFLSYDFARKFENVPSRHAQQKDVPGFYFGFYDRVITVDHFKKTIIISSSGYSNQNRLARKKFAKRRLLETEEIIAGIQNSPYSKKAKAPVKLTEAVQVKSYFTQGDYCKAVEKVLDYIKRGEIYQANVAQQFKSKISKRVQPIAVYRALRALSPSCFGGYLEGGEFQILSSSPELFLSLYDGVVRTRPMKGTRPRGQTSCQDRRQCRDLRFNQKEKAELLMVTDLERNDLGRVCEFGSVKVEHLRVIEKYRTVYQATATVAGKLAEGKDGFDVIAACFPSGSVTGCPKIRSMKLIDQLERSARGIYTGALGYMSFSGDMALNVLIRTILLQRNRGTGDRMASFHAGSGIVADSNPRAEYEETLIKTNAMRNSLGVNSK